MSWETRRLADVATFLSGGTPSKANDAFWAGTIPWVSAKDLVESRIYEAELNVTEEAVDAGSRLVPENTVLFVVRGMSLANQFRISLSKVPVAFNQDLKALRCNDGIDPEFVYYALFAQRDHIKALAGEAAHGTKKLPTEVISEIRLSVPDMAIQKATVKIVSAYDDLIENNRRRIALLNQSARLLYREWFMYRRFPGHEHVKVVNGVPEGWERRPLGDLLTLQRGFDLPAAHRIEGEFPIYAATGINGFHNKAMVTGPGVITGRSGSLGTVLYSSTDFWPLNTALWVKEFKRVSPEFALFLLGGLNLEQYNGGVAVPTLNRNDVHRIEVLLPPKTLLDEFTDVVLVQLQQIDNLNQYNEKLGKARDLLLPRLMNGEIKV